MIRVAHGERNREVSMYIYIFRLLGVGTEEKDTIQQIKHLH